MRSEETMAPTDRLVRFLLILTRKPPFWFRPTPVG
jgi:hypothetical protein